MEIDPHDIVPIDYNAFGVPVQKLQPTVYMDGDSFCCLSGPDPETGVFGCGDSPAQAVEDWQKALVTKLNKSRRDDATTQAVRKELGLGDRPVSDQVKEFYAQFRPAAKRGGKK